MAQNIDVTKLLPVNWFDGLAVKAAHLKQVEHRLTLHLSLLSPLLMLQSGILYIESISGKSQNTLFSVGEYRTKENRVAITFERTFAALAPNGGIVQGIRGQKWDAQFLSSEPPQNGEYLLVLTHEKSETGELVDGMGDQFQVVPCVILRLIAEKELMSHEKRVLSEEFMPIGKVLLERANQLMPISNFVPPVVRLDLIHAFSNGLLNEVQQLLNQILPAIKESFYAHLEAARSIQKKKRTLDLNHSNTIVFLQQCSALFVTQSAYARNIGVLSPDQFLKELLFPLTELIQLYGASIPEYEELKSAIAPIEACRRLNEQNHCLTDTAQLLSDAKIILHSLAATLGLRV